MSLDNAITKLVNDRVERIISNLIKNDFTENPRENNNENFSIDSLKNMTREQQVKIMNHIYTIQNMENRDKYPFYCDECRQVKQLKISFGKQLKAFTCLICKMTYCDTCSNWYRECEKYSCVCCQVHLCGECKEKNDFLKYCQKCNKIYCLKCETGMANEKLCLKCENDQNPLKRSLSKEENCQVSEKRKNNRKF